MKSIGSLLLIATIGVLSETYNYQLDIAYQCTQLYGCQTTITPRGSIFSSVDTDTDDLSLSGSWYFSGLTDNKGPRPALR